MQTRILSVFFSVLLVLLLLPSTIFAAENSSSRAFALVDGQRIDAKEVDGLTYLFLPASANSDTLEIQGITSEEEMASIQIMKADELPTIYLNSSDRIMEGRSFVEASKANITTGTMKMVSNEGNIVYDGDLTQIKARGNSTFLHAKKKSYQIKLDKKSDLLEKGEKVKTWVLLAGYYDATKIHDKTMKDLAASLGMPYVASCNWVNLYYDDDYRGVYLLGEKNQINKTSVNIADLEDDYAETNDHYGENPDIRKGKNRYDLPYWYTADLIEPEDLSGGYLLELNGHKIDEASGFFTEKSKAINVKSPEWAGDAAMRYISEFYQEFEDAVYATNVAGRFTGYNSKTGKYYYDYVDKDSLVRMFLLQELSGNPDEFSYSTFFYKDKGSDTMFCGPIWDQEMVFGTGWYNYVSSDEIKRPYLVEALTRIPDFQDAVRSYYQDTFHNRALSLIAEGGTIEESSQRISRSMEMDHILWPFIKTANHLSQTHLWGNGTTYQDVVDDMAAWIRERLENMDKYLGPGTGGPLAPPPDIIPENGGGGGSSGGGGGGTVKPDPVPLDDPEPVPDDPEPTPDPIPEVLFEDVPDDAYYCDPVKWAVSGGVTNGIDETHFGPDLSCTRAQMVTFLWRAAGSPDPAAENNPFTDVEAGSYYEKAVLWAVEKGITNGTSETTFSPEMTVTRGQSVTFLYRFAGEKTDAVVTFEDVEESAYYEEAVQWAVSAEVTKGTSETTFEPVSPCTRAQIVTFLYRTMAE